MTRESPDSTRKCPVDAKIVAISCIVMSVIPLIAGLSSLMEPDEPVRHPYYVLFGMVFVRLQLWAGIFCLIGVGFSVVTAYGLIRLRAYGWWLLVADILNGILRGVRTPEYITVLGLVLVVVYLGWAIFRWPLYKPIPRRWRERDS